MPGVVDVRATEGQQESSGESKRDDPLEREVAAKGRQARPKRFQVKAQKRADAEDGWGIQREKSGRRGVGHGDFGATRQDLGEQPFGLQLFRMWIENGKDIQDHLGKTSKCQRSITSPRLH